MEIKKYKVDMLLDLDGEYETVEVCKYEDIKKLEEENKILKEAMGDIAWDNDLYWSDIRDLAIETLKKIEGK